ncbi:lipopolysaccharide kinase InaA family protein [Sansalvadorimonas verongulae]|uniref:lipopolysaccharide kinase InaA family protein n=1 Tax=Sansalvadorimonas verongulae TaxID=2172824 RepID=UPI0012BB8820|nr:lipopolysaccharide kinase InaA family protein [Sansalvadorimonas verongulae]MTI15292.1 hypothetical protein [Sansalvadorimonas verongulae]
MNQQLSQETKVYTAEELPELTEAPEVPFIIVSDAGDLLCQKVLRFLPGKRIVVQAVLNEQPVVTKCFYGPKARRDAQRELDGISGFQRAEVSTPALIAHSLNDNLSIVATALLAPVESFEQEWHKELTKTSRRQWIIKIGRILASMHKAGVRQTDIHLDNLLLHKGELVLIDGGGARISASLSRKEALENLALFQAVLYPMYDNFIPDLWNAYSQVAPDITAQSSQNEFSLLVQQQRKWRERFVQKSLRNCTQFRVYDSWREFVSVDKSEDTPALRAFLANPEPYIESGKVLKRGTTNTVAIVTLDDGEEAFVKRYKSKKGFLHKYVRCLTTSRARISWLNGHLLHMLGVKTPKPLAMKEKRFGPITTCSYIINRFQPSPHALEWFTEGELPANCKEVRDNIDVMLNTLKRSLIFHGDLKATNILLVDNQPVLIDLDAMTSYKDPQKFYKVHQQDIKRFARNWDNSPEVAALFEPVIQHLSRVF